MTNDQQKQDHRYHKYQDSLLGACNDKNTKILLGACNEGQTDALDPEAGQVQCG